MRKAFLFLSLAAIVFAITGCGAFGGLGPLGHSTNVTLDNKNFQVIQSGIMGQASVQVLFPVNFPMIGELGFPLGDANLYKLAMEDLRTKLPKKENIGLVNISVDSKLVHYLVIGTKTITITADVVEFN
jgi:predicted small lipoprotein YifL